MKAELVKKEGNKVTLKITVDNDKFEAAVNKAYNKKRGCDDRPKRDLPHIRLLDLVFYSHSHIYLSSNHLMILYHIDQLLSSKIGKFYEHFDRNLRFFEYFAKKVHFIY